MGGGQFRNHFNAVRMRATGSGNLKCKLLSLDEVYTQQLADLALQTATDRYPTQLANMTQQKVQLELKLTAINEYFDIRTIILYSKPVSTGYPQ